MIKKIIITLLLISIFSLSWGLIEKGAIAPEFTLKNIEGKDIALKDFTGKVILIDFWAIWCTTCKAAIPELEKIYNKYKEQGVVVLGINIDKKNKRRIAKFLKKTKMSYPVLLDKKSSVPKKFAVNGIPTMILVGKDGKVVETFVGFEPGEEVKIEKAIKELLK